MPDTSATLIDLSAPQLRADQAGYLLDGSSVDGFADRPDLDAVARRQIAAWADTFGQELSTAQRALLAVPAPEDSIVLEVLAAATRNADVELPLAFEFGLFDRLTDDQRLLVREPWRVLGTDGARDYPLNVTELAELTGTTPKQVREWEKGTLLPGYRIDGRRQFFSAAVVHAFALAALDRYQVAALGTLQETDDDDPFVLLVEHTLAARHRRSADKSHGFGGLVNSLLGQIRTLFVPVTMDRRAENELRPLSAEHLDEWVACTSLVRSVKLHDAFGAMSALGGIDAVAPDDKGRVLTIMQAKHPVKARPPSRERKKPSDQFLLDIVPNLADVELSVHPSSDKGWTVSADLGFSVPRKGDALKLGKRLSAELGDGAVRVYSKDDGRVVVDKRAGRRRQPA